MAYDYDLLVVGGGPGGHRAAIAAAKLGRWVAIVDRKQLIGVVCINTGTFRRTLREAVVYLTGMRAGWPRCPSWEKSRATSPRCSRSASPAFPRSAPMRHPGERRDLSPEDEVL
jgi:hypothetical protein